MQASVLASSGISQHSGGNCDSSSRRAAQATKDLHALTQCPLRAAHGYVAATGSAPFEHRLGQHDQSTSAPLLRNAARDKIQDALYVRPDVPDDTDATGVCSFWQIASTRYIDLSAALNNAHG